MTGLYHLIYCSVACEPFAREELADLLNISRRRNGRDEITGILLYAQSSFFQVLEGKKEKVEDLFTDILNDPRHHNITVIVREPIPGRSFEDWTMGYADLQPEEIDQIIGANDFFTSGKSFTALNPGRIKGLLAAFRSGSWRARISGSEPHIPDKPPSNETIAFPLASVDHPPPARKYKYAFQPIIDMENMSIFSFEALLRGLEDEPAHHVLRDVSGDEKNLLDNESRLMAIHMAAYLGLDKHLNLNIIPSTAIKYPQTIAGVLDAARRFHILPQQIILEILEGEVIEDLKGFAEAVRSHRNSGMLFAIDDFGAGSAGLNLLAEFQPNFIKLDMHLVRAVNRKGPRQAIVRGILSTCFQLGIDVIAEGVETEDEYRWLRAEGINLFQGFFFAEPQLMQLPRQINFPKA